MYECMNCVCVIQPLAPQRSINLCVCVCVSLDNTNSLVFLQILIHFVRVAFDNFLLNEYRLSSLLVVVKMKQTTHNFGGHSKFERMFPTLCEFYFSVSVC